MRVIAIMMASVVVLSCTKTEVIGMPEIQAQTDTMVRRKAVRDTIIRIAPDTTRVPIGWNPTVSDWNKQDIEL